MHGHGTWPAGTGPHVQRSALAVIAALTLSLLFATGADAAVGSRTLRARLGAGGQNGTVTVRVSASGTGSVVEALRHLAPSTSLRQGIFHGACGALGSQTVRLPRVTTTRIGRAARVIALTSRQVDTIRAKLGARWKLSIVVGSRCARLAPVRAPSPGGMGLRRLSHIVVIVMENHEYGSIVGSASARYLNALIAKYSLATNDHAVAHPSEPNYLALWSGSTQGVGDDGMHNLAGRNLADQLAAHHRTWRVFAQNVPLGCSRTAAASGGPDGSGTYARKHEPAISFTDISGSRTRCANITDLGHFDPAVANLEFIVPNMCNDMHDCSIATGDGFLSRLVPRILASAAFKSSGALFISWDEGTTNVGGGGRVATLVIGPTVRRGFRSSVPHTHYSLIRTIEDAWGLGCLNRTCAANDLHEFFR